MPEVVFFRETNGTVPALEWMVGLPDKARVQGLTRIESLTESGHLRRRPQADHLRDGIHELRFKRQRVNYRLLYFFHGSGIVVLSHGITKQQAAVPPAEIQRAIRRRTQFTADPEAHTHRET